MHVYVTVLISPPSLTFYVQMEDEIINKFPKQQDNRIPQTVKQYKGAGELRKSSCKCT